MKTLMMTTAILATSTLGASAQDLFRGEAAPDEIRLSELMGMSVYASEAAWDATESEGVQGDWSDIGDIDDVVLSRDGSVEAVLLDVGGFLGIGERQVAVSMDQLRLVSDSATPEDLGDYFLVVNADRAALEGAPAYEAPAAGATDATMGGATDGAMDGTEASAEAEATVTAGEEVVAAGEELAAAGSVEAGEQMIAAGEEIVDAGQEMQSADAATAETGDGAAEMTTTDAPAEGTVAAVGGAAARTPLAREGYVALGADEMTADTLRGATVYDASDERVGQVDEIVIAPGDGQVERLVVDVGGFLGLGETPVALPIDSVDVLREDGGDDLRVYLSQTREDLEAMETYEAQ